MYMHMILTNSQVLSLTIHLSHGLHEVVWVLEADKAIALGFLGPLVPDDLGLLEGRVFGESSRQEVIIYVVSQVTHKYSEVV